jgi:hypothetical protein
MTVRFYRIGAVLLAIAVSTIAISEMRAEEELRSEDYGAIMVVVRQELSAVGKRLIRPVCLRGPVTKVPPKSLFVYLSSAGVDVREPNECYPAEGSPRGLEISLSSLKRGKDSSLRITVETGDITPRPGVHVGELLRLGTYELREAEDHTWKIVSYKNARPDH